MKKKLIIIVSVILAVALIITGTIVFTPKVRVDRDILSKNAYTASQTAKYVDGDFTFIEDEYTLIGDSGNFELYYNSSDYTIKVRNKTTGYEWSSMVGDDYYIHNADKGKTENTEAVRKKLSNLVEIGYTNYGSKHENTSLNSGDASVKYKKLENGISIEADFTTFGFSVTIEIWVDEDGLNVRVPVEKIKESEEYGILNMTILPMFGAANDSEKGFILFPDATGAIFDFNPVEERRSPVTVDVYFPRDFDLDDIEKNNQQGVKNAIMPFFGLTKGDNAFVAYVTQGEMNSYITLTPSGSVYKLNRVASSIIYRKSFTYLNSAGEDVTEIETDISCETYSVHYSFLNSDDGDVTYSDMANTLRDYLVKTKKLVKAESAKEEKVNVNLQMLMATKAESMIAEYLLVMTKCDDVVGIVERADKSIQDKYRMILLGWQSSGYNLYPSTGKKGNIGSISKMSEYLESVKVDSYLVDDLTTALSGTNGFSEQSDAVYNQARLPVTNSVGSNYVRNPYKEYVNLLDDSIPYYKKNDVTGVGFDKLGWYVFDDYQKKFKLNRFDTVSTYRAMLAAVEEAEMKTAFQRGNAYILDKADYIYDLPKVGSNISLLNRDVPFYELVVHGYVPYSLDIPGNMSVDYKVEKLKWIEYGAEPTYLLTQEMSEKFKDSNVGNAFSTEVATWEDDVAAIAKEFNKNLAFTNNNTMQEHLAVADNVYRVTYSNGYKVYVNYNTEAVTVDGLEVLAEDYIVVKADGTALAK